MARPYFAQVDETPIAVSDQPKRLRGAVVHNPTAATVYLKVYEAAAPTYASDPPDISIGVAAGDTKDVDLHECSVDRVRLICTTDPGAGVTAPTAAAIVTLFL